MYLIMSLEIYGREFLVVFIAKHHTNFIYKGYIHVFINVC